MFEALHAEAAHSITVPLECEACFQLFTPIGETAWVPGWSPRYLHPADGITRRGMVFTTGIGAEETFWTVVDYDTAAHYARYARVTPGSRSVLVEIRCTPAAVAMTRVDVRYELTGLTESGNKSIRAFVGEPFARMIEGWRSAILELLDRQSNPPT
jgi:hypothetical protein